jgi:chromosome segregation ATPase
MSLPRATQFTIGALLAALLGWGILIFSTAAHDDAAELWAQQRGELEQEVTRLGQSGEQLQARVAELRGALEQERAAAGDLASVLGRIDDANTTLSARMATLGERERQIAEAEAGLAGLQSEVAAVETRIDRAKASLNQRMAVLGERERDLAARRADHARLTNALAATEGKIDDAAARLNRRMTVLGERDRDLVDAGAALTAAEARVADQEARLASATARLNHRFAQLGEAERRLVDGERSLQRLTVQAERTSDRLAGLEIELADRQTALGRLGVELAAAERTLSRQDRELARSEERLGAARAELAAVEGQLEHALLASDVADLSARRDDLTRQVAALDEDIRRKGPLAESALALNTRVVGLEEEIIELSRERDQTAVALRQAEAELRLAQSDRAHAAGEYAELVDKLVDLREQKTAVEAELAGLGAEVRHQDSVFATLEVLRKEQDFLRGLIGTMLDEGQQARDRVEELRLESAALATQKLALEKDLINRQAEIDVLDKAIMAKDSDKAGVSAARAF